jgi:nucleoside-diphosphate-sugar epimerase
MPGGGTTDYAVHIFYSALQQKQYTCYLAADTCLDMMYMPDAVRAAIEIMEADPAELLHRNAYNITAMSFTPAEIGKAVTRHIPDFVMRYQVDPVRQAIADSWPNRMDDSAARNQWGWQAQYNLETMTTDMLARLTEKLF